MTGRTRPARRLRWGAALVGALAVVLGSGAFAPLPAQAAVVPPEFAFTGGGWGHGIGMSQYGAYGQALEGRSATQILEHYYAPARVTKRAGAEPSLMIDVQVLNSRSSAVVRAVGSGQTVALVHDGGTVRGPSVTFTVESGRIVGTVNGKKYPSSGTLGVRWRGDDAAYVEIPYASSDTSTVRYRYGEMLVTALNGRPNIVNRLRLHTEYLYGLAEMPSSWPAAALQAQAIAGRTYALRNLGARKADCACHVYDEVRSQKFTGWNKAGEATWGVRWRAAVDATIDGSGRAQVLTHDGALIEAFYSSSTGGRTVSNKDAWGSAQRPYLQSRDDRWSTHSRNPYASWTETRTQKQVAALFGLPDVARLEVTSRSESGAVMQVRATSSTGRTANLVPSARSDSVRTALGLRSAFFDIGRRAAVTRMAGSDRYATAVEIGKVAFPSATSAVIVNGAQESLVDGLVAAPLARKEGVPVLLSRADSLPGATRSELVRRKVTRVTLVGGEGVLTSTLVRELRDMGITVDRVGGKDRYRTAAEVARAMGASANALIASGLDANLIDAAASSGPAARTGRPVLLVKPDGVPGATRDALADIGVEHATIVGGSAVVTSRVASALRAWGMTADRAGGTDRYATAAAVADKFKAEIGTDVVLLAGGTDQSLVDSLTGGVLGHVTLLVKGTTPQRPTREWFIANPVATIRVAGGRGTVTDAAVSVLRTSMS